ncbi:MAG: c-type cytochrome [Bryobacteraceae bacterium]
MRTLSFNPWLKPVGVILLALAVVVVMTGGVLNAQVKQIKKVPVKSTPKDSGVEMYKAYCASCHGMDGKGKGPAASALKMPATDLTTLSKNNGGKFPELKFQNSLRVSSPLAAHGSSDMPTWGPIFRSLESGSDGFTQMRVYNLTKYVEGLQVK